MPEFPFAVEWIIPEKFLKALKNSTKNEFLKSNVFTAFKFSPIPYHFEFFPNGNNNKNRERVWIFLQIPFEFQKNVHAEYTFTIKSANWSKKINYIFEGDFDGYGSRICKTHEFFKSSKKFIVDGKCTVKIEGVFKIENVQPFWDFPNRDLWNQKMEDFKFQIGESEIHAHESIFASESPIFAAMFEQLKDENEKIIEIPDFSFEIVEKAVKLCYYQKINILDISNDDEILVLLQFATKYDFTVLKNNLELHIGCNLTVSNVSEMVTVAKKLKSEILKNKCFDFLIDLISKKKFIPKFTKLDKEFTNELFQTFLCVESETYLSTEN
uniref:BTB domain-containing protein n=1 Tax=Panagrolaimus davidi TaxID=227884 RepID=A0A914Q885_9BILA